MSARRRDESRHGRQECLRHTVFIDFGGPQMQGHTPVVAVRLGIVRWNGAMIKLVYCITKKSGLTDEEFFRYWKDVHGPIGARIPYLRRLVQSHRRVVAGDMYQHDFDGIAELWFDDEEALLAARESVEWKASREDEKNFIDPSKVAYFVSTEHTIY